MYRLMIVDDEEFVRTSIATIVDWNAIGFGEVLQAADGVEALKIALQTKPDLVLTDIRMPFMDGLELSKKLKKQLPDTRVVMLSGHDEFSYAQEAISIGVLDYIMKPIGATSLTTKMIKIKEKLDIAMKEKNYLKKASSQLHQSLPVLQEKFLNSLVCIPITKEGISSSLSFLEIPMTDGGPYVVCVIEPDLSDISIEDKDIYLFAIKNIASETFGVNHLIFSDAADRIVVVISTSVLCHQNESSSIITDTLTILKNNTNLYLKIPITVSIGNSVENIEELYTSYSKALTALEAKFTFGKNKIYHINDLNYIESEFYYPFDASAALMDAVMSAKSSLIEKASRRISDSLVQKGQLSAHNIKLVFIDIISNLLKLMSKSKETSPETWAEGFSLYRNIEVLDTIEDISGKVTSFSIRVSSEMAALRKTSTQNIVDESINYIKNNYNIDDMSLSSVAAHVSVSSGYLSTLFKKETGENLINYLNSIRLDKAMELLRTTDLKTYEIAYQTGFSNPHYFSITFKKHTGLSPSDFRGGTNA